MGRNSYLSSGGGVVSGKYALRPPGSLRLWRRSGNSKFEISFYVFCTVVRYGSRHSKIDAFVMAAGSPVYDTDVSN